LIDQDSFPIGADMGPVLDGGQFGDIVEDWRRLVGKVEAIKPRLRPDQRDAYFQLVEYPVLALSNLYEMYYATAWNRRLASRNDARANAFADQVETAFKRDADLTAPIPRPERRQVGRHDEPGPHELRDLERSHPTVDAQRHPRGGRHPARQAGAQVQFARATAADPHLSPSRPPSSTARSAARA
jgi:hypothetical protein